MIWSVGSLEIVVESMLQCLTRRLPRRQHLLQRRWFSGRNNHSFRSIGASFADSVHGYHSLLDIDILLVKEPFVVATSAVSHEESNTASITSLLSLLYAKIKQYLSTWYRFLRQSIVFTPVTICAPIAWLQCQRSQNISWFWDLLRNSIYISGSTPIHWSSSYSLIYLLTHS